MPVTLDLSEAVLNRLRVEAERRQLSVDALVEQLAASLPTESSPPARRGLSFIAIGASTSGQRASKSDRMLAEGFGRDGRR